MKNIKTVISILGLSLSLCLDLQAGRARKNAKLGRQTADTKYREMATTLRIRSKDSQQLQESKLLISKSPRSLTSQLFSEADFPPLSPRLKELTREEVMLTLNRIRGKKSAGQSLSASDNQHIARYS